jgi:hypothetical protein
MKKKWTPHIIAAMALVVYILRRMKMKKKGFSIVSVLLVALVFAGCTNTPKVYDPSVPLEQSCTLRIYNLVITNFDGEKTKWGPAFVEGTAETIIPAGSHSMSIMYKDAKEDALGRIASITEYQLTTSYEFLPKRTYLLSVSVTNGKATAQIKDVTEGNS